MIVTGNSRVPTLDALRQRCVIDPHTGCWHCRIGMRKGFPTLKVYIDGRPSVMRARRAALLLMGRSIKPAHDVLAVAACVADDCVNPKHARIVTRSRRNRESGRKVTPAVLEAAMRRRKLPDAEVLRLRAGLESIEATTARFGLSRNYVERVVNGKERRTIGAGSVFTYIP